MPRHKPPKIARGPLTAAALLLTSAGGLLEPAPCRADQPSPPPLTAAQQEQIKERDRLDAEAQKLRAEGKLDEAVATVERLLAIERRVFGPVHAEVAGSLQWLSNLHLDREDFAAAREAGRQCVAVCEKADGPGHWRTTDARQRLEDVDRWAGLSAEQRRQLRDTDQLLRRIRALYRERKYREALPLAQEIMTTRRQILGTGHYRCAIALYWIGRLQESLNALDLAEQAWREELSLRQKAQGDNPEVGHVLYSLGVLYDRRGDYDRAESHYRQAMDLYQKTLGRNDRNHTNAVLRLDNLALEYEGRAASAESKEDFAAAHKARARVLAIRIDLYGEKDWEVTNARLALADSGRLARMTPGQRQRLKKAREQAGQAATPAEGKDPRPTLAEAQKTLAAFQELLGPEHPQCATLLARMGQLHSQLKEPDRAGNCWREVLALREKVQGENHPDVVSALYTLAWHHLNQEEFARADEYYTRALNLEGSQRRKQKNPFDHRDDLRNSFMKGSGMAGMINALRGYEHTLDDSFYAQMARRALARGDAATARSAREKELARVAELRGEKHWRVTDARLAQAETALLAGMSAAQRQQLEHAEQLRRRADELAAKGSVEEGLGAVMEALKIYAQLLGAKHPRFAAGLVQAAHFCRRLHRLDLAEASLEKAVAIQREILGETHVTYAISLGSLADLHRARGEPARAEPLYREALAILRREPPEYKGWPSTYFTTLHSLATLYHQMGASALAAPLLAEAVAIRKDAVGVSPWTGELGDMGYSESLTDLASLHLDANEPSRGFALAQEAAGNIRRHLDRWATTDFTNQSEAEQLRANEQYRSFLDLYLSLAVASGQDATAVYTEVLAWKGAVSARQHVMRVLFRKSLHFDSKAAGWFRELEEAGRRLSALAKTQPEPGKVESFRRDLKFWAGRFHELEGKLARSMGDYRNYLKQRDRTAADVQRALPPDAVLFDLFHYQRRRPRPDGKGKGTQVPWVAAFVLRQQGPVTLLDLGPAQELEEAVASWRRSGWDPNGGAVVRKLVWDRLEENAPDARLVLISPDDFLARLPWAALPGTKPEQFLIEEKAVALVPLPRLLPELLAPVQQAGPPSLLLVGGVDFEGAPGKAEDQVALARSAPRPQQSGTPLHWHLLPGTDLEVEAIRQTFRQQFGQGDVAFLSGGGATEAAVRSQAPRHRNLHLATHGYFAAPGPPHAPSPGQPAGTKNRDEQTAQGVHPGLLSGLVLAGANRPVAPELDDGILTALEVEALDLSGVDLAVLSACETGLGKAAGGEGLLGLQRAFQVAGARSVVASLWQVDDAATQHLMTQFYDNLWRKKLPRLEALRQAQLAMLHGGGGAGERRGLDLEAAAPGQQGKGPARAHPRLWAAWALSGDPGDLSQTRPAGLPVAPASGDAAAVEGQPESAAGAAWPYYAAGGLLAGLALLGLALRRRHRPSVSDNRSTAL